MRIEQLQYLIDIGTTKSISKTAQNFYITQQGVSDAIKKLEQEFDTEVLQRTKYGVLLTPLGEFFVEKGQQIITLYDEMASQAALQRNSALATLEGELTIMSHARIFQHILPSVIQAFCLHCPKVHLKVMENPSPQIISNVLNGSISLGLIAASEQNSHLLPTQRLNVETLFCDNLIVCVHHTSPLRNKSALSLDEVTKLPVITYDFEQVINEATQHPERMQTVFTSNDIEVHRKFVEQGLAVDVMSHYEYRKIYGDSPLFTAIPYKKDRLAILLLTNTDTTLSPQAAHFIQLLHQFHYS